MSSALVSFLKLLGRLIVMFFSYKKSVQRSKELEWSSHLEKQIEQVQHAKTPDEKTAASKALVESIGDLNPR